MIRRSHIGRRGLSAGCALLLLCLPACEEDTTPESPAAVTLAPAPAPAVPSPPAAVPVPAPPLLLACQAQPRAGDVPLTVSFRSFPSGGTGAYAFDWRFGDGDASTQPHPRHTYLSRGSFLATLRVASGDQAASCERSINPGAPAGPTPLPGPSPSPGATPIPDLVITIVGDQGSSSYAPNPADAHLGQRVIWHNADVMTHTATGAPAFDTGFVAAGTDSAPITMGTAGTFPYRCLLHPGMTGTLRVTP